MYLFIYLQLDACKPQGSSNILQHLYKHASIYGIDTTMNAPENASKVCEVIIDSNHLYCVELKIQLVGR